MCNDAGQLVDFHALRGTFITMLVKGGATVKEAQQLARHGDPKLTMNVYTKLGVNDVAGALGLTKTLLPSRGTRKLNKSHMLHNDACPEMRVDAQTFDVYVDGELATCEPAATLPLTQRYMLR